MSTCVPKIMLALSASPHFGYGDALGRKDWPTVADAS